MYLQDLKMSIYEEFFHSFLPKVNRAEILILE